MNSSPYWIALETPPEQREAWGWHALRFTPRVAALEEVLLLEVSTCLRLWGGLAHLRHQLFDETSGLRHIHQAQGATSLVAIGRLRCHHDARMHSPNDTPAEHLPLHTLSAARPHATTLARLGCRTLGDLRALPRAGLARRFGAELLQALDHAFGLTPETYPWLSLPPHFVRSLELPAPASASAELLASAAPLLELLQHWLQARQLGVSALHLRWTLERQRHQRDPAQTLLLRTMQPVQQASHLKRLLGEHLARCAWPAPAERLQMRALKTQPWLGQNAALLADTQNPGEPWAQLLERLSARLGAQQVLHPQLHADQRPEHMQRWQPALSHSGAAAAQPSTEAQLYPRWLLEKPQALALRGHQPWYHGPLQRLTPALRLESGWWDNASAALDAAAEHASTQGPRDYFIAHSPGAGLVWIYRRLARAPCAQPQWFLHGVFG